MEGFDGWYVASFPWTEGAAGKAVQLKSDGTFDWKYQTGDVDAWINQGGKEATIEPGYDGESDVAYPEAGAYIYEIAYFKLHNSPCEFVPEHQYTIIFLDPFCEENPEFEPAIAGDFNNWLVIPMAHTEFEGKTAWTITFDAEEGEQYKLLEATRGWENEFQWYDEENDEWKIFSNSVLPVVEGEEVMLLIDYSDPEYFRYPLCGTTIEEEDELELLVSLIAPVNAPEAGVEIMGGFNEWSEGILMTLGENGIYTASLIATESTEFKFREAGTWDNEIIDLETGVALPNFVIAQFLDEEKKNVVVDLSDSTRFIWKANIEMDTVEHAFTIHLLAPNACPEIKPAIIGDFNGWSEAIPMAEEELEGQENAFVISISDVAQHGFKFVGVEDGQEWSWENELLQWNSIFEYWEPFNNILLPQTDSDVELIFDFSDNAQFRFGLCEPEEPIDTIPEIPEPLVPTEIDLANYADLANDVVLCLNFDEPVCNDIVLVGTYNEWQSEDVAALTRFEPMEGFDGWYVASFPWTEDAAGKAVQLKSDGTFDWKYQTGDVDAWINQGGKDAIIEPGFDGESNVSYPEPGAYIYEIAYFKNHNTPCEFVPEHQYTIILLDPVCEENPEFVPAIAGDFNYWEVTPMEQTEFERQAAWTFTVKAEEGEQFKFLEATRGWANEFQWYDEEDDVWRIFNNSVFPKAEGEEITLIFDFSDTDYYRYGQCGVDIDEYEFTVILKAPAGAPAAGVELMGGFNNWSEGILMSLDENGIYTASLIATKSTTFKFREAGNWGNTIVTVDNIDMPDFVIAQFLDEETNTVLVDLSDSTRFIWRANYVEPIEPPVEIVEGNFFVQYLDEDKKELHNEIVTLQVPVAPEIEGFVFFGWQILSEYLEEGIILQATYIAQDPQGTPDEVVNPANKAQKLIRNGNIYILTGEVMYTITGQKVK